MPRIKTDSVTTEVKMTEGVANAVQSKPVSSNGNHSKDITTRVVESPKKKKNVHKGPEGQVQKTDVRKFSLLDFIGVPIPKIVRMLNDFAYGKPIVEDSVRTLLYYGLLPISFNMFYNPETASELKKRTLHDYFDKQLTKAPDSTFSMTEVTPKVDGYAKRVRYYDVVRDLIDVCRNYPDLIPEFTFAFKIVAERLILMTDESQLASYKDQKGGIITDFPLAMERLGQMRRVMDKIRTCDRVNWELFDDFTQKTRLFCPGFAPKDWGMSVK